MYCTGAKYQPRYCTQWVENTSCSQPLQIIHLELASNKLQPVWGCPKCLSIYKDTDTSECTTIYLDSLVYEALLDYGTKSNLESWLITSYPHNQILGRLENLQQELESVKSKFQNIETDLLYSVKCRIAEFKLS